MKLLSILAVAILFAAAANAEPTPAPSTPTASTLSWSELSRLPLPTPGERITYGSGPQQFGELRLPAGDGPSPVVVLLHGGCWQAGFDYVYMTRLAAWLTDRGVAVWTIEYRRLGDAGGGWPGTFLDAANATDALRRIASKHSLDLKRVYAVGHSAGGQLALWLASRGKLPAESELFLADPLPIQGILGLAAITDLEKYRDGPPDSCHSSVDELLGGAPDKFPKRYAETSPRQRLPLGVPQVFIQGQRDPIVDPVSVQTYVDAAKKAGDRAMILPLPAAGHFETSVPIPASESQLSEALRWLTEKVR
ncbi:MAG: alpha/beta hydrolase [Chthoniobacterales bacterium]